MHSRPASPGGRGKEAGSGGLAAAEPARRAHGAARPGRRLPKFDCYPGKNITLPTITSDEVPAAVGPARCCPHGGRAGDQHLELGTVTEEEYDWGEVEEEVWDEAKDAYVVRTSTGQVPSEVEVPSLDGVAPLDDSQLAGARIGQALYARCLLDDPSQRGYGAAKDDGYSARTWC